MQLDWKEFEEDNIKKMMVSIEKGFGGRLVEFLNFVEINGLVQYADVPENNQGFDFESVLHGDMDSYTERNVDCLWADEYIFANPILLKNPDTDMTVMVTCPYFALYDQEQLALWCAAYNICCRIYDFKKEGGVLAVFGTKPAVKYTTRCIPEKYMVENIETIP